MKVGEKVSADFQSAALCGLAPYEIGSSNAAHI
jgi:hypothetical protein